MRRLIVLLAAMAVVAPASVAAGAVVTVHHVHPGAMVAAQHHHGWTPPPAKYKTTVEQRDVRIRMDDGVDLAANIIRPSNDGKTPAPGRFPVIVGQTPYNKNIPVAELNETSPYLAEHGYIEVSVDVRGTGSSEGTWTSFGPREQKDYLEVARWARHLPGSDGKLATYGVSYGGIDSLLTAEQQPKGLKAVFAVVPMADAYRDVADNGGDLDVGFIPFWMGLVTATAVLPPAYAAKDPVDALETLGAHLLGITKFQVPTLASAATGDADAYDGAFYKQRSPLRQIKRDRVPTYIVGGERDLFQRGEPMLYNALRANGVPSRLLVGPWTHAQAGTGLANAGMPTLDELALRWFDHYVKGTSDHGLVHQKPVTVWRLGSGAGAGRYQHVAAFPSRATHYRSLRLGGSPSVGGRAGTLGSRHPAAGAGTMPYAPVAGVCSESLSQWTAGLYPATAPCASGNTLNDDLGVTYDLPVTGKQPLRFSGTSMARLYLSTTGTDASITARLEDVAPDGTATSLTNGWQVLSLRRVDRPRSNYADGRLVQPWHPDTATSVLPVKPGATYRLDVEIFPTTAQVAPGHALRLAIQSADVPHLLPPVVRTLHELGGSVTVHADRRHHSALILGVQGKR